MTGLDRAGTGMPAPRIASDGVSSLSPPNLPLFGQHLLQQALLNFYYSRHFLSIPATILSPTSCDPSRRCSCHNYLLPDEQILPAP